MSIEDFVLLISGLLVMDVLIVSLFLRSDKKREKSRKKDQSEAEKRVRMLSPEGRESYKARLGKLDLTIEQGRYTVALEAADSLLADVMAERGFPEEGVRNGRTKSRERRRGVRLQALSPEAAGAYASARTRSSSAPDARKPESEERLGQAAHGYRDACEALI